jgi:hypothetical protein
MRLVEGKGSMFQLYRSLQYVLPVGAQLLWDDWRNQPSLRMEDVNQDGKEELVVTYRLQNHLYTTIFAHDYRFWYALDTVKSTSIYRVMGIDLYPASIKGIGGKKWGYINHKGKFVTPVKYEDALDFQPNGLASVKTKGKYGLINQYGQFIVYPQYNWINPFSEGRAVVTDDKGFRVINERGKVLTSKVYGFIGDFQEQRAIFYGTNEAGEILYGFLNRQGKEIIPIKYESVTNFNSGKAVGKIQDGKYELIDLNGKILQTFEYVFVGEFSEGFLAFQPTNDAKYGFINDEGKVVIEPKFESAQAFKDGRAVVNMGENFGFQYGLIDRTGKFVYEPVYNNISMVGDKRVTLGKAIDKEKPFVGSLYALADTDGNILSDYKFYDVGDFNKGYASATEGTNTFFIDRNGQMVKNLPIAKGNGTLSFEGALIKGNIDLRLRYYNQKGTLVWSQNQIIPLNDRFRVIERKFSPNKDYLVYYPEIQGMRFEAMQKKVNSRLAQLSGVKEIDPNQQLDSSYIGDFEIFFFRKHLVIFELNGYDFPFGAAHGMPKMIYAHVDLESGVFYELKDLFKPDSSYVKVLSEIIGEQIKNDPQYSYVFPDSYKGIAPDQPFYVDAENLYIYFSPYEIGPYVAGFPTFKIPFTEIDSIINKTGAFWRAFH